MSAIALVGMPNVGKTALFNALTGSFQKVANFPGVTVEKKTASMSLGNESCDLVDLPGLYSLDVATLDEKITRDWLMKKEETSPVLVVLDATHLQKSLYLLMQLLEIGHRPVVALTQIDESRRRGQELNLKRFEELAGVPVIPVSGVTGEGLDVLREAIRHRRSQAADKLQLPDAYQKHMKEHSYVSGKFKSIDSWLKEIIVKPLAPDNLTDKIDRIVLHPVLGFVFLFIMLLLMFQALFTWAGPFADLIESGMGLLDQLVRDNVTSPILQSFLADGIIAGVGGVVVFLPQILLLFFFIQLLEDVGYLGRAVFLMDGFMRKLGLPGKAVIPLLSSHACAIPGIMATRIMEDRRERLIAMMVIPLTTCSARLPVFALLVAALVPATSAWGPITWQGLMMFMLYLVPMVMALVVAGVLRNVLPKTAPSMLLMELPPYRIPKFSHLWRSMINKSSVFLTKAGKFILLFSMIIWVLVFFPRNENGGMGDIEHSYAADIGRAFEPVFAPLGFDWKINTALIPAFGAREVLVSAMATVFAVEGDEDAQAAGLHSVLATRYSAGTLGALLVWFIFAPQCISTLAVLRRESTSWAMPTAVLIYTLALAWVAAFLTYYFISG